MCLLEPPVNSQSITKTASSNIELLVAEGDQSVEKERDSFETSVSLSGESTNARVTTTIEGSLTESGLIHQSAKNAKLVLI